MARHTLIIPPDGEWHNLPAEAFGVSSSTRWIDLDDGPAGGPFRARNAGNEPVSIEYYTKEPAQ